MSLKSFVIWPKYLKSDQLICLTISECADRDKTKPLMKNPGK